MCLSLTDTAMLSVLCC